MSNKSIKRVAIAGSMRLTPSARAKVSLRIAIPPCLSARKINQPMLAQTGVRLEDAQRY